MSAKQKLTDYIKNDQNALERAILSLKDLEEIWHPNELKRIQYFANWLDRGNHLSGRYVEEARQLVLLQINTLLQLSLEKTREKIKFLQAWEKEILSGETVPNETWKDLHAEGIF